MIIKLIKVKKLIVILVFALGLPPATYAQRFGTGDSKKSTSERRYTYYENDGIFVYYETQKTKAYRSLLPSVFKMPDRLFVYTFIIDFYKMDSKTQPYKEAAIFLLAKYKGKEVWHCIFMPVTSNESRLAGIMRLGLPKTMGDIKITRSNPVYIGNAIGEDGRKMSLHLDTKAYTMSKNEEQLLKQLSVLPKLNLRKGKIIEIKRGRGKRSIIDLAKKFSRRLILKSGKAKVAFEFKSKSSTKDSNATAHPLDLTPSKILGAYYLQNKIPFRLGGGQFK